MTIKTDIDQLVADAAKVHSWATGSATHTETMGAYSVRSPAKLIADKDAEINTSASGVLAQATTQANNAAASYDAFDDRYLGSKSSAPTVDNDGNALLTGALYWNTAATQLYVWTGSAWNAAAMNTAGVATLTGVETLTNKTITSPVIDSGTANGITYLNASKVLTSGSALTFDGTNFSVPSGITFPATQVASANANTLDDYEEGTWTPAVAFDVGGTGIVYGARQGTYTKIGRLVYVTYYIEVISGVSGSDYFCRLSLPFTGITLYQEIKSKQYHSNNSNWWLSAGGGANPVFFRSNALTDYADGSSVVGQTISGHLTFAV